MEEGRPADSDSDKAKKKSGLLETLGLRAVHKKIKDVTENIFKKDSRNRKRRQQT